MKSLSPANQHFLLEISMEDLHKDIALWLSEIEFWRVELLFFQKLVEKAASKTSSVEDKQRLAHFQNLLTYYQGEVADQFEKEVHQHELYLTLLCHFIIKQTFHVCRPGKTAGHA
jgi:hypothetical protein